MAGKEKKERIATMPSLSVCIRYGAGGSCQVRIPGEGGATPAAGESQKLAADGTAGCQKIIPPRQLLFFFFFFFFCLLSFFVVVVVVELLFFKEHLLGE